MLVTAPPSPRHLAGSPSWGVRSKPSPPRSFSAPGSQTLSPPAPQRPPARAPPAGSRLLWPAFSRGHGEEGQQSPQHVVVMELVLLPLSVPGLHLVLLIQEVLATDTENGPLAGGGRLGHLSLAPGDRRRGEGPPAHTASPSCSLGGGGCPWRQAHGEADAVTLRPAGEPTESSALFQRGNSSLRFGGLRAGRETGTFLRPSGQWGWWLLLYRAGVRAELRSPSYRPGPFQLPKQPPK